MRFIFLNQQYLLQTYIEFYKIWPETLLRSKDSDSNIYLIENVWVFCYFLIVMNSYLNKVWLRNCVYFYRRTLLPGKDWSETVKLKPRRKYRSRREVVVEFTSNEIVGMEGSCRFKVVNLIKWTNTRCGMILPAIKRWSHHCIISSCGCYHYIHLYSLELSSYNKNWMSKCIFNWPKVIRVTVLSISFIVFNPPFNSQCSQVSMVGLFNVQCIYFLSSLI